MINSSLYVLRTQSLTALRSPTFVLVSTKYMPPLLIPKLLLLVPFLLPHFDLFEQIHQRSLIASAAEPRIASTALPNSAFTARPCMIGATLTP